MSDLISRSALISHIVRKYWKYGAEYNAKQIWKDIENFPTAFELYGVIEELEKEKENFKGDSDAQKGVYLGLDEAIGVIRKYIRETAEPPKTD